MYNCDRTYQVYIASILLSKMCYTTGRRRNSVKERIKASLVLFFASHDGNDWFCHFTFQNEVKIIHSAISRRLPAGFQKTLVLEVKGALQVLNLETNAKTNKSRTSESTVEAYWWYGIIGQHGHATELDLIKSEPDAENFSGKALNVKSKKSLERYRRI